MRASPTLNVMAIPDAAPQSVYLLWHVHHVTEDSDGNVVHFTGEDAWANEKEGDDVKFLGAYSSEALVEERVARFREMPGFRDEPNCFWHAEYEVDEDQWIAGYITDEPGLD